MTAESRLPRLSGKPWLRAFLLTSPVFGSGLVVGIVLTSAFLWQRAFDPFRQPPGFAIERIINDMRDELVLSDEQSKQLEEAFKEHHSRMETIRADVDPKMRAEFESLQKQVESILRPEQAARWNQRFGEMQKRFMRGPSPDGHHPGPPGMGEGPMRGPQGPGFGQGGPPMPPPFPMPGGGEMRPADGQPQPPDQPMQGMEQRPPNAPRGPGMDGEQGPPPGGDMNGPMPQRPEPPQGMHRRMPRGPRPQGFGPGNMPPPGGNMRGEMPRPPEPPQGMDQQPPPPEPQQGMEQQPPPAPQPANAPQQ